MKVSLWQQFSSNHSSEFTVVGRFGSEQEAEDAAEKFRQWMTTILWQGGNRGILTEIEAKISEEFKLDWYKDGIEWNGTPNNISEVVRKIENDVFITCPLETWDSPIPFVGLMWKIGAHRVNNSEGEQQYLFAYLTCEAPDEITTRNLYELIKEYLKQDDYIPPPWENEIEDGASVRGEVRGVVWKKSNKLVMRLQFQEMSYGIGALIDYLAKNGCRNIKYNFSDGEGWNKEQLEWPWTIDWPSGSEA
jgi:hypothetical protein